jgi:hypothetical protein
MSHGHEAAGQIPSRQTRQYTQPRVRTRNKHHYTGSYPLEQMKSVRDKLLISLANESKCVHELELKCKCDLRTSEVIQFRKSAQLPTYLVDGSAECSCHQLTRHQSGINILTSNQVNGEITMFFRVDQIKLLFG